MSEPRRHHYLPRFYLENFVNDNGFLSVFDREKNEYRFQQPVNTAVEKDMYRFKDVENNDRYDLENAFSRVENDTKAIIDKLDNSQKISKEDVDVLSIFLSAQRYRVPRFFKTSAELTDKIGKMIAKMNCPSIEQAERLINDSAESGKTISFTPKELFDFVHNEDKYKIGVAKEGDISLMTDLIPQVADYLKSMDWSFYFAPKDSLFITSDNPFILVPDDSVDTRFRGYGLTTPGVMKVFPLSPKTLVVISNKGHRVTARKINTKAVRHVNLHIARQCDRFIIAREKILLERIVHLTKIDEVVSGPKIVINGNIE